MYRSPMKSDNKSEILTFPRVKSALHVSLAPQFAFVIIVWIPLITLNQFSKKTVGARATVVGFRKIAGMGDPNATA